MVIEPAKVGDIPDMIRLWRTIPATDAALGRSDEPAELERFLSHNLDTSFLMREGSRMIGTVLGGYDGRRGYIYHLAIHPSHQRRGYGRALLDAVLQKFREIGVLKVHLFVFRENYPAIEFYRRLGWAERDDIAIFSFNLADNIDRCSC